MRFQFQNEPVKAPQVSDLGNACSDQKQTALSVSIAVTAMPTLGPIYEEGIRKTNP